MPAPVTTPDLLDLVRRSELVDPELLTAWLAARESGEGLPGEPRALARLLVRDGLLTRFQAETLLKGKCRGLVLGNYAVLERIGAGGNGAVYLAEHRRMGRKVALKVLASDRSDEPGFLARFRREGRAAAALDHPNIVHAYDVEVDGRVPFLVMEYVDGPNLQEILARSGRLDVARAAGYARQAAAGLDHAHRAGVVHRDIKPANLLVSRAGVVKILDMGLAKFFHDETDALTREFSGGAVLGTADYVAPEQARDGHGVDTRADLYSLGATLYYLLAGQPPFAGGTLNQKLMWHQMKTPTPLTELRPEVPRGLAAVVARMLAKDPADRFQTPAELVDALAPWAEAAPAAGAPAVPTALDFSLPVYSPGTDVPSSGSETLPAATAEAIPAPPDAEATSAALPPSPPPDAPVDDLEWAGIVGTSELPVGPSSSPRRRPHRFRAWHLTAAGVAALGLLGGVLALALRTRPAAPTSATEPVARSLVPLRATVRAGGEVDLVWEAPPDGAEALRVERATSYDGRGGWEVLATVGPGASRYTDATAAGGAYYYRLTIPSTGAARAASAVAWPQPDFAAGFRPQGLVLNGGAAVADGVLRLTDAAGNQARSAFYNQPLAVRSFTTSFRFRLRDASADGFTFCLQHAGPSAVGGPAGGLGYAGLPRSVAVKFDLWDNSGEGPNSTGVYTGGAPPERADSADLTPAGIDLHSGRAYDVTVAYSGRALALTVADAADPAKAFRKTFAVDVPGAVGGPRAFAGFTAGTGGSGAVQEILSWTWSSTP